MMHCAGIIEEQNDQNIDNLYTECDFQFMRPAEIKEDVKLMEQRHRVSEILRSDAFHMALNNILGHQLQEGEVCGGLPGSANLCQLKNVESDMLLPRLRLGCSVFNKDMNMPIVPINDLISMGAKMTKQEKFLRCKLASIYRLIDLHGWGCGMLLYASSRIIKDENNFLTNCYGLMNHEVTAGNLIKINFNGDAIDGRGRIDQGSWHLHAAIHQADPSMRCVVHIKTPSVVAVSCMRSGLVALSDEAMRLRPVPMYEWGSRSQCPENNKGLELEQHALGQVLGSSCCIFVRNRGLLARGRTVEETWLVVEMAVQACEIQMRLATVLETANTLKSTNNTERLDLNVKEACLNFEAMMRSLDATGHQTGYLYRHIPLEADNRSGEHDNFVDAEEENVQIPPSATSLVRLVDSGDEDEVARRRDVPIKGHIHATSDYVRQETDEAGPSKGRKIVTWHQVSPDKRRTSGTVEVCTSPNQSAPQGKDPLEFRHQQQKIKAKYFKDETSAGHQSKLLRTLESETTVPISSTESDDGGCRVVTIGAVSRGIIDKQHRQDPSVYQTSIANNPFTKVTDDDLHIYQDRVNKLANGEPLDGQEQYRGQEKVVVVVTNVDDGMTITHDSETEVVCCSRQCDTAVCATTVLAGDDNSIPSLDVEGRSEMLRVTSAMGTMRSETSGAYTSHDDTEIEALSQGSETGVRIKKKKQKKSLRTLFSFRKDKSK